MGDWFARQSTGRQVLVVVIGVFVTLGFLVAIFGGDDTATTSDKSTTATTQAQEPAPAEADTGRMTTSEWETASAAIDEVNGEIREYREGVSGRCSTILSAGEVAAGLKCVDDAFDGVEGQAGVTTQTLGDLIDDTAKSCRKELRRARNRLNRPLFRALRVSKAAIDANDVGVAGLAGKELGKQLRLWGDATGDMLERCAPA